MKRILAVVLIALATAIPAISDVPKLPTGDPAAGEARIRALDKEWARAEDKRDGAVLERLLDANFVFVGASGGIKSKASYIAAVLSEDGAQEQAITSDLVRVYGDTGISVGTTTVSTAGDAQSSSYRYTAVYILRAGEWKAVACQLATVKPQVTGP